MFSQDTSVSLSKWEMTCSPFFLNLTVSNSSKTSIRIAGIWGANHKFCHLHSDEIRWNRTLGWLNPSIFGQILEPPIRPALFGALGMDPEKYLRLWIEASQCCDGKIIGKSWKKKNKTLWWKWTKEWIFTLWVFESRHFMFWLVDMIFYSWIHAFHCLDLQHFVTFISPFIIRLWMSCSGFVDLFWIKAFIV